MSDSKKQFARVAENYLTSKAHDTPNLLLSYVEKVRLSGGTILDVATGAGHTAFAFAPFVETVVATDITDEMLRIVAREAPLRGHDNIKTAYADATDLPFDDSSFEGVTCRVAAHHFPDVPAFLREVFRVLASPGWFLLVDTVTSDDPEAGSAVNEIEALRDPSHVHSCTPAEWEEMISLSGLELEWREVRENRMPIEPWFARMKTPTEVVDRVRPMILESTGATRDYFQPVVKDGEWTFRLLQVAIVARKS